MKFRIILILALAITLLGCNKEEAKLEIKISAVSSLDIKSDEAVDFVIEGTSEFLVFYSGLEGQVYDEYPNVNAEVINGGTSFSRVYNHHGSAKAVFVATSYGNWSEDSLDEIFEFTINVIDDNSALEFVSLKNGIFGDEYIGVIDEQNGIVTITIPQGVNVSNITANLVTASIRAIIFNNGEEFENKTQVDFSSGSKIFKVKAIDGSTTDWVVNIDFQ